MRIIITMMDSLNIDKNLLNVHEEHFSDGKLYRTRSERASSLALPHSSLLDFYDKQQEQCSSIALLPTTVNSIVRRHSSHYYPMLEDKQQQQPEQVEQNQQPEVMQKNSITALDAVYDDINKYCKPTVTTATTATVAGIAASAPAAKTTIAALETPPPPIPKRTFRERYAWNASESSGIGMVTPDKQKLSVSPQQQQYHQQQQGIAFVYPQNVYGGSNVTTGVFFVNNGDLDVAIHNGQTTLFDEVAARSTHTDCGTIDADGISDDDRMSLDNSVFDESVTSTPVKVAGKSNGHGGNFSAKTLAALGGDFSHVAKRCNRSSSSTVDSVITSGYVSGHSERFASTSTTADFRSRFSSVDTQSSLDTSSFAEKPTNDIPLSKATKKTERATANEQMRNFNNNETHCMAEALTTGGNHICNNNNNNDSLSRSMSNKTITATGAAAATAATTMMMPLPVVPARKQYGGIAPKIPPPTQHKNKEMHEYMESALHGEDSTGKRVSTSASSTSTASAGSSTLSGSSMSSISAAAAPTIGTILPPIQKRPVPPAPPLRSHNSVESNGIESGMKPPPLLTIRNKLNRNKPPPIVYPKLHQRQDSNLSSDSYSMTSSPGYNSKNLMDAPLLQNAARINKSNSTSRQEQESLGMTSSRYGFNNGSTAPARKSLNYRQDSNISSDSFSATSSPGYNTKTMEAPLLPSLSAKRICSMPAPIVIKQKLQHEPIEEMEQGVPMTQLAKCVTTPASLQTIVRFQNGTPNTIPLQHQILSRRKSSNPYITNGRLKFRLFQILINALALFAIAGGLAAYFNAYPTIKFVNKTIINTVHIEDPSSFGKNPAPGTCLPIIVKFCQGPQIPYNYTVFPNYIGHFGQLETQVDLDAYEALVDVRCYELVSLFLCTLFVPKCGSTGATVPPCQSLCTETMRRCGFFLDVFGLTLPEYLNCKLFKDFISPNDCVGFDQVRDVLEAEGKPTCDGYLCDKNRCLPNEYVCDGHLDCMDQEDESKCERCGEHEIYCGDDRCIGKRHVCDGIIDCPYGQDERNCMRLSERNGDFGKGILEVYRIYNQEWTPACVKHWDRSVSPSAICSMLGYNSVNATAVITQRTHRPLLAPINVSSDIWEMYTKKHSTLIQEFTSCKLSDDYPMAEITCSNYQCGRTKRGRHRPSRRIIGGSQVVPGTWPFLAAILGGPEKIFYCAGVLISDQWVLTASHCIGNHTLIDLEDWTIQLGVTRRNSFTYSGIQLKVRTVIPHPQYNTAIAHDNDIALFQLASRVTFHDHLLPVCLPPPNIKNLMPKQMCTVIGWGKRDDKDPKSTYEYIVNEVQVPIIRRQQCDEWLDNLTVSEGMICAGYEEGGRDACQGDSGGPLLCPYPGQKDRWFVAGIVSWGIMCAHPKLPGVYANVLKYVPWIHEQMQKYARPISEDLIMKYDIHPGGPDILSNMATNPKRYKKPYYYQNRSPMDIDYYDDMAMT